MKKLKLHILLMIISALILTACSEQNAEAPSTSVKEDKQLKQIDNNNSHNNSIIQTDTANNDGAQSKEIHKAENLVRQYLELGDSTDTIVEYDHVQNEKLVIHVYDIIDKGNENQHLTTRGWYIVDLQTEHIEVLQ